MSFVQLMQFMDTGARPLFVSTRRCGPEFFCGDVPASNGYPRAVYVMLRCRPDIADVRSNPLSVQIALLLVDTFLIFLLMWDTYLFGYGLLGALCSHLKPACVAIPLYAACTTALRLFHITAALTGQKSASLWDSPTFHTVFYAQSCGTCRCPPEHRNLLTVTVRSNCILPRSYTNDLSTRRREAIYEHRITGLDEIKAHVKTNSGHSA
jgi:hypothetical protein